MFFINSIDGFYKKLIWKAGYLGKSISTEKQYKEISLYNI
jgi:hypothetical protein